MKLKYKFFSAFLVTSFLIVFLLVGIMQVFIYSNFAEFVNQQELEKLDDLVYALAEEYRQNTGWEEFRRNPWHWRSVLDETLPEKQVAGMHRPAPPIPERGFMGEPPEHMPPPDMLPDMPPEMGPPGDRPHAPLPPPARFESSAVEHRLNLFDRERRHIAGPGEPGDKFSYREIRMDGEIAGWLGIKVVDPIVHPLGINFLTAQKNAFYIIGVGIFLLAACISYLLSRHLISPIQELMKGTRAMASYHFDTEITVGSKDELGMLANDFNHMAQTLRRYEEIRKNWISDISHELRTPISILKGKIEALQDGIRQVTPETLDSLHNDVTRLGKLVEDLHFLSVSDSDNLRIRKTALNPLTLLKEIVDTFQIRLDRQSIRVRLDFSEEAGLIIMADRDRLSRLFSNLIENTLRYTDSPGTLKIGHETDLDWFTLYYEDSAPGVPDEAMGLIFNRLYRVDQSRSRALGGSGLGLSICRQIVENHRGTITSEKSPLGGLKIIIRLPAGKKHQGEINVRHTYSDR